MVTDIGPVVAPAGKTAVTAVEDTILNALAPVPLNFTTVAPENAVPVIETVVPGAPDEGVNDVIRGRTANALGDEAVPA